MTSTNSSIVPSLEVEHGNELVTGQHIELHTIFVCFGLFHTVCRPGSRGSSS